MTVTAQQWVDGGHTRAELRSALTQERMTRVRRGVYLPAGEQTKTELHLSRMGAANVVLGERTYFAHVSAAVLHGLPLLPSRIGDVTVVRTAGGHGEITETLHSRTASLRPDEIDEVRGLPVTSLARTVADLVRALPFHEAVMVADAALARGLSRNDLLARTVRGRGCRMADRALTFANPLAESPGESLSRARMEQAGVPIPCLQRSLHDSRGIFLGRVDFFWEEYGIVGEFDGAVKYGAVLKPGQTAADVVQDEKRRERALREAGFLVVRWTWKDLFAPDFSVMIRRAISSRAH